MHSTQNARNRMGFDVPSDVRLRPTRWLATIVLSLLLCSVLLGSLSLFQDVSHSAVPPGNGPFVGARDPLTWPFTRDSIWNLPVGSNANYVWAGIRHATSMAYFTDADILVLKPTAPLTTVYTNYDDWGAGTRCAAQGPALYTAPIPANFVVPGSHMGSPDGDTPNAATAILAADGHTIIQTQPFARCAGMAPTSHYTFGTEDLYGKGETGSHGGSGLSALGGTVRLGELVPGGTIPHALKLNIDSANFYPGFSGYRWPAWKSDAGGAGYSGSIPEVRMGSLLAVKPDFPISTLESEPGRIVAAAFMNHGAYIVDTSGWSIYNFVTERSPDGSVQDEFARVWGYPLNTGVGANGWARDLDKIFTNLWVVNNWDHATWQTVSASAGTLGVGLGAPRVAWAPDFGVVPPPPVIVATTSSLTTSKNPSAINETVTVSGRLVDGTAKPVAGRAVTLEWSGDLVTWVRESQIGQFPLTDANGAFTGTMAFRGIGTHSEYIRANFVGDGTYGASISSAWTQSVVAGPSIDTIAPVTTYLMQGIAGNSNWYTSPVTVSLTANDVGSGVASVNIRLDGGTWTTYTSPVVVSADGSHTVEYYSIDVAGNRESIHPALSFRIDTTAPTSLAAVSGTLGSSSWYVSPATVTLTGADSGSGLASIRVSVDGARPSTYAGPLTINTNGVHTVDYYAIDVAGNRGVTLNTTLKIDLIGPASTAAIAGTLGTAGWYTSVATVSLSAASSNGTTTTIAYRVDGGPWASYAGPMTVGEGRHVLAYQASDSSGAVEALHSTGINVDATAPTIDIASGAITIPMGGYISWTGSDAGSGIASYNVSVDGGLFQSLATKTTLNGPWGEGPHTAIVKARDAAGNEATKTMTFRVDKNAPAQVGPIPNISEALLGLPVLLILGSMVLGLAGVGLGVRRARRAKTSEDDTDRQIDEYLDEVDQDLDII